MIVDVLHTSAIAAWLSQPASDPPTASEEMARMIIVELFWIMHEDDPDSIGPPGTQPRDVWMSMLGESYADQIAAAVAVLWP